MGDGESDRDCTSKPLFNRRTFAGGLIAATLAGVFHPLASLSAFAEPTSAEKQAEADEVRRKLDAWAVELEQATEQYYLAIEAHDAAVEAMNEAKRELDAAEAEVTRLQDRLGSRVTSMYKQGQFSFLEVLFGAHSFSEFTSTWDLLNSINSTDASLIEQSKIAKREAQTARDEFAGLEKIAQEKLDEADEIRADAERIVADYEAVFASLEAEVAALIEKEREEEARRQREAAAAAAAAARSSGSSSGYRGDGIPVFTGGVTDIICQAAISRLGCPYVWAATGPDTFDCSGLTQWCYRQAGITITRTDYTQRAGATSELPVSEALPGDILWKPGHVGIYMGGGAYIHAPQPGDVVRYAYNMNTWVSACRY